MIKKQEQAERLMRFMKADWIGRPDAYEIAKKWDCMSEFFKLDSD